MPDDKKRDRYQEIRNMEMPGWLGGRKAGRQAMPRKGHKLAAEHMKEKIKEQQQTRHERLKDPAKRPTNWFTKGLEQTGHRESVQRRIDLTQDLGYSVPKSTARGAANIAKERGKAQQKQEHHENIMKSRAKDYKETMKSIQKANQGIKKARSKRK